ncbi:MAG: PorT family protein [Flavobacteriaceae bacterium]|nr:PorT family protein [Flavobacteriaceae bacterium]
MRLQFRILIVTLFLSAFFVNAQVDEDNDEDVFIYKPDTLIVTQEKYREDQFYVGFTYNLLLNKPNGVSQRGFSNGIHIGFIRDMPINERRNIAFGLGLGYSKNSYSDNLVITQDANNDLQYQIVQGTNFSKNKLNLHMVEVPFQFRWRTSTLESHKFWRIYAGFKLGYIFASKAKFNGDIGDFNISSLDQLNNTRYNIELNFGYNTWNFHATYSLNSLFNDQATLNGSTIEFVPIKIGLLFYIF